MTSASQPDVSHVAQEVLCESAAMHAAVTPPALPPPDPEPEELPPLLLPPLLLAPLELPLLLPPPELDPLPPPSEPELFVPPPPPDEDEQATGTASSMAAANIPLMDPPRGNPASVSTLARGAKNVVGDRLSGWSWVTSAAFGVPKCESPCQPSSASRALTIASPRGHWV